MIDYIMKENPSYEDLVEAAESFAIDGGMDVTVVNRGKGKWAVTYYGDVLDVDGTEFYSEPSPSNRDDDFLAKHRFDSVKDAVAAYRKYMGKHWRYEYNDCSSRCDHGRWRVLSWGDEEEVRCFYNPEKLKDGINYRLRGPGGEIIEEHIGNPERLLQK